MSSNHNDSIGKHLQSTKEKPVTKSISLSVLVLGVWLIGCTSYQATLTNEERSYPATIADNVRIFFQGENTPAAKEIGHIVVLENSEKEGVDFLRKKAAEMGADGMINVEVKIQTQVVFIIIIPIPIHSYFVSGTAIKFTN
jgi:uncharacterized protein YbjQ (UPF0145 family)